MRESTQWSSRLFGLSLLPLLLFSAAVALAQEKLEVVWRYDTGG